MTRRIVTTRRADEDIENAIAHYVAEGATSAALGFVDALENAKDLLSEYPLLGSSRFAIETGISELRSVPLGRFPYLALYTDSSNAVRIHRVLHTSRDIPAELTSP